MTWSVCPGGRNIADRYFDFDTNCEFKDRDILVYGPVVLEMRESFDWFWVYEKSVPVQYLRDIEDDQHLKLLFVDTAYEVDRIEYYSDKPRKAEFPDDSTKQDITTEIHQVLSSARKSIVIQSPYMVLSKKVRKIFRQLRQDHPKIAW